MIVCAFALDELHCEPCRFRVSARRKDLHDVRVVQLRDRPRLVRYACGDDLDGDIASKRNLPRQIDCAHAAATKKGRRLEVRDCRERRRGRILALAEFVQL